MLPGTAAEPTLSGYRQDACASCGSDIDRFSQCGVMKLRPHPGTTILFCAIKENPRRKNCRVRIRACWAAWRLQSDCLAVLGHAKQFVAAHALWCRANTKKSPLLRAICEDHAIGVAASCQAGKVRLIRSHRRRHSASVRLRHVRSDSARADGGRGRSPCIVRRIQPSHGRRRFLQRP